MNDAAAPRALATLMARVIDYAGLFPPAGLSMADAVAKYAACRASACAWALGRFVVPAARLDEFQEALGGLPRGEEAARSPADADWQLSAIAVLPLDDDLERIAAFEDELGRANRRPAPRVASIEIRVASPDEIARVSDRVGPDREVYFELPLAGEIDDLCRAARGAGRAVKLRTGGTTLDAFPPSSLLARAIGACARAGVPFKATAGLHHPLRSRRPITYEPSAPAAMMHGFLNVFVAAALLFEGRADEAAATRLLEDELARDFEFREDGLRWREQFLDVARVEASRRFARSFGSCSLSEPLDEVGALFHG